MASLFSHIHPPSQFATAKSASVVLPSFKGKGSKKKFRNSTPLASKVRCSISVLGNSSTSVIFQSPTPLRVRGGARGVHLQSRGVQHRFVGGAKGVQKGVHPPKSGGAKGVQHPCQRVHPLAAPPNISLTKVHRQMLHLPNSTPPNYTSKCCTHEGCYGGTMEKMLKLYCNV